MSKKHSVENLQYHNDSNMAKALYKPESNAVKLFIEYAKAQGCTWHESVFHEMLSNWRPCTIKLPTIYTDKDSSARHHNTIIVLLKLTIIKNTLIDGMAENLHWTRILAKTLQQLHITLDILI